MEHIIAKIHELIKGTEELIKFKEQVNVLMHDAFIKNSGIALQLR